MLKFKQWLKTRQGRLLMKSFFITLIILTIIVVVGVLFWNRLRRPPEIRPMEPIQVLPTNPYNDDDNDNNDNDPIISDNENDNDPLPEFRWPAPERFTDDNRRPYFYTFLIIGLNEGYNANTVMVASYCHIAREANIVSIPRDVAMRQTGNARKLSSSFLLGMRNGGGISGGVQQVQLDVLNTIGFVPDYYVVIDYEAFFTIIDTIGGVDIYVPVRMLYEDPYQNLFIDIMPGMHYGMDSQTALNFVRFRRTNHWTPYPGISDFQRIQNQQALVQAVINQLLRPQNLLRLHDFVSIFNESVHTDIGILDATFFAFELNDIRRAEGDTTDALSTTYLRPVATSNCGLYLEFLSPANVLEIVNSMLNPFDQDIELRDLRIVVQ